MSPSDLRGLEMILVFIRLAWLGNNVFRRLAYLGKNVSGRLRVFQLSHKDRA